MNDDTNTQNWTNISRLNRLKVNKNDATATVERFAVLAQTQYNCIWAQSAYIRVPRTVQHDMMAECEAGGDRQSNDKAIRTCRPSNIANKIQNIVWWERKTETLAIIPAFHVHLVIFLETVSLLSSFSWWINKPVSVFWPRFGNNQRSEHIYFWSFVSPARLALLSYFDYYIQVSSTTNFLILDASFFGFAFRANKYLCLAESKLIINMENKYTNHASQIMGDGMDWTMDARTHANIHGRRTTDGLCGVDENPPSCVQLKRHKVR